VAWLEGSSVIRRRLLAPVIVVMILGACGTSGVENTSSPTPTDAPTPSPTVPATDAPSPTADVTEAPTPTPERTVTPTIGGRPANDDPPGTLITSLPFTDSTNVALAQIHAMEGASQCGSGSQSVWYSFTAPASETVVADTQSSDYDTIVDVWRGSLVSDLTDPGFEELEPVACNDNSNGSAQAGVVFEAVAGQQYVIRVLTALNTVGGDLHFSLSKG
jgi:hypothetical protein